MGHPYYPIDAALDHYSPNVTPLPVLVGSFGLGLGLILTTALVLARRASPRFGDASVSDQALFLWFILCGSLHSFFEGYFVVNHATLAGSQTLLAQLWKEYALSDSRYLTSDPFTLCVEAATVVAWGPLSWAAAVAIAFRSHRRYVLQIVVCLAHLYGVALYYGTVWAELRLYGVSYFRPEAFYVWVYFIGFNAPWVVVPAIVMYKSIVQIERVFAALDKVDAALLSSEQDAIEPKKTR